MKAKGRFISFLLVLDTFFVAYAYGFHSHPVLVVDPKLPPLVPRQELPKQELPKQELEKQPINDDKSKKAKVAKVVSARDKSGAAELTAKATKTVTKTKAETKTKTKAKNESKRVQNKVEKKSPASAQKNKISP